MRSMMEGPSSGSNSSFTPALEGTFKKTRDHPHHGYDVVEKVRLTDGHAEPHGMVGVYNMDMETVWTISGQQKVAVNGKTTHSTKVGNEYTSSKICPSHSSSNGH